MSAALRTCWYTLDSSIWPLCSLAVHPDEGISPRSSWCLQKSEIRLRLHFIYSTSSERANSAPTGLGNGIDKNLDQPTDRMSLPTSLSRRQYLF